MFIGSCQEKSLPATESMPSFDRVGEDHAIQMTDVGSCKSSISSVVSDNHSLAGHSPALT